jgi:hypothetical protein
LDRPGRRKKGLSLKRLIPEELNSDLWIWKKMVAASRSGLPLRNIFGELPLDLVTFVSDTASADLE